MNPLQPPDSHYVSAAVGWLGLGNCLEAQHELEQIAPPFRQHPEVLLVQWAIYAKHEKWAEAADVAKAAWQASPEEPQSWIHLAYANRRKPGGGLAAAREILAAAHKVFPKEPIIAYNLACYDCQLGDLKGARQWLQKAFAIGDSKNLKRMVMADPDLEPLRAEMGEV